MSDLAAFQDDFTRALRGEGAIRDQADPAAVAAGLTVYRNTIAKGALDALAANYPTVERLVGDEWFAACARLYFAEHPPASPILADYGEGLADFLGRFEPARDVPYLAAVARIDRFWTEAHIAEDAEVLTPDALAALEPTALAALVPRLHPSTRIGWFEDPAPTIWRINRPPVETALDAEPNIAWRPEGILLVRDHGPVSSRILTQAEFTFLACCKNGRSLGDCATAALSIDADCEIAVLFAELIALGAFAAIGICSEALATSRPDKIQRLPG